jgi:hypothetical protein
MSRVKEIVLLSVLAFGLQKAALASVVTLDFSSGVFFNSGVPSGGTGYDTYTQSGFTLLTANSLDHLEGPLSGYSPAGTLSWHKTGSNPSTNNVLNTHFGGLAFDLLEIPVLLNPQGLIFTSSSGGIFNLAAGATGLVNFATLGNSWQNITSFTIGIVGNADATHRIDHISLNNTPTVPAPADAVPEPVSQIVWCCLATGVVVIRWRAHRRVASSNGGG